MRRLSFILVVAIIVGGLSLGSTHATAATSQVHSSILLAQVAVQPPAGFLSGIASAIDKMVTSVIDAVKAAFGFIKATPAAPVTVSAPITPKVSKSTALAAPNAVMPVPLMAPRPVVVPAPGVAANVPSAPMSDPELSDELREMETGTGEAKPSLNMLPASVAKPGAAIAPSAAKAPITSRPMGAPSATPPVAPSAAKESGVAKSAAGKDPLKLAEVSASPMVSSATASSATVPAPAAASAAPVRTDTDASRPAVAATAAPATRAETPVAAQPMFYAQPIAAPASPARATTSDTPVVRSTTPTAPTPVVRAPVVAVPRFIDSIIPERPVTEPVRERVARTEEAAVVVGDAATLPTRGDSLPARIEVDVRTLTPTDLPPENPATVRPPADAGTPVVTAPALDMPRMIILNDGTQQVIIQPTAATTSIIDPASTEAVVCRSAGDFPILSLGEDDAGIARGVVLATGTILLKPTDFFKKFVRLEGAPFAIEAIAKDCGLLAHHARLSTPDLIINMPKLSETDRELISAKSLVVDGGRVFIVAADNTADKTLRGIVVRESSGRLLFKLLPERNQVAQTVRGMTVLGDLMGRMTADIVLSASDGSISTQHCEFTKDTDMTCTTRGAL